MPQQPIDIDNYDHFSGADWNDVINNIFGNTNSDCYKLVQSYLDAQEAYLEKIDEIQDDIASTEDDLSTLEDEIEEWMAPFLNGIDRANFNPNFTPTQQAKFNTFVDDLKDVCIFKFIMSMLTNSNMPKLARLMGTNYAKVNLTITSTNHPTANPDARSVGALRKVTNPDGTTTTIADISITIPTYRHPSDSTKDNYHFNLSSLGEEIFHAGQIAHFTEKGYSYDPLTMEVEAKVAKTYAFYKSQVTANDTPQDIDSKMDAAGFLPYEKEFFLDYNSTNTPTGINPTVKTAFDNKTLGGASFLTQLKSLAQDIDTRYQNQPNWNTSLINSFLGIDGGLFTQLFTQEEEQGGC